MLRIAHLVSKHLYESKMSRGRFDCVQAVAAQPGVELTITGKGWPEWHDNESCTANFSRLGMKPTWIWAYKHLDHIGIEKTDALRMVTYNETYWEGRKALAEVEEYRADLVIAHHENSIRDFHGYPNVVHVPHAADPATFYTPADTLRPIPCLLTGVISNEIYPLRGRLKALIESRHIPGEIRKHPGYRLASHGACNIQTNDYAQHLGRAKIALCCTSKYRYCLAKIPEAAMAGCVVATDMPDDSFFKQTLGRHIIELDNSWTDSRIVDCIQSHLADEVGLLQRAIDTQKCALAHFTMTHYASKVLGAMRDVEVSGRVAG